MKVSILVPCHNAEKFIAQCVKSLFEQTYQDIEYIFVDDCSKDNTTKTLKQIIENYRIKNFKIIHNKTNKGIAETRNILLKEASGEYIYFVDSDDFIKKDTIEIFVNIAELKNADIVRCCYNEVTQYATIAITNCSWKDKSDLLSQTIGSHNQVDAMWKLFIRRDLFIKHHILFEKGINACEDYIMSVKLFYYANTIIDIPNCLYNYCIHNNNISMTKQTLSFVEDMLKASDSVFHFLNQQNIYERYKVEISQRILVSKQAFLLNKKLLNLNKYLYFHPETNITWRTFNYGLRERVLFLLAEYNCKFAINLLYKFM